MNFFSIVLKLSTKDSKEKQHKFFFVCVVVLISFYFVNYGRNMNEIMITSNFFRPILTKKTPHNSNRLKYHWKKLFLDRCLAILIIIDNKTMNALNFWFEFLNSASKVQLNKIYQRIETFLETKMKSKPTPWTSLVLIVLFFIF